MFTVQSCFDLERPDLEDQNVRDYLLWHELESKYEWEAESEGRSCTWVQFGGCYLGSRLNEIGLLQRRVVEVELLSEEFSQVLGGIEDLSDSQAKTILAALASEFQSESSFQVDSQGELVVILNKAHLDGALERLLAF